MSRNLQDQFIDDDEEETCPLCVEEFDLTDKGFRPCPCGYQICQFCYHNVKNNMNGLCPACRRPYNDKDIEYKVITPEETAAHKARQAQKQKKTQAALQKEKQKAEADHLSRKHLAGLRVVQKNLVYVTGLSPTQQEDQLLQTLRGDQYFGQYGKIVKIVVSKAKDHSHPHSVGVYVTYERKEDAAQCIAAVNGARNGDRSLRAQFGTTKYCSAYLRGETCTNRQCMFLHEPGEANESYSRADLSALNAGSTQHGESKPPPPQSQQPVASAAQPMARQPSDQPSSPVADRPALPSTASWASKPIQQPSRSESRATSGNQESPAATTVEPVPAPVEQPQEPPAQPPQPATTSAQTMPKQPRPRKPRPASPLLNLLKNFNPDDFKFVFSLSSLPQSDVEIVKNYPPLFDLNGGAKRRLRRQREEEQRRMEQEAQAFQEPPLVAEDDNPEMSGSLQLGGEPEERQPLSQSSSAIRPPGVDGGLDQRFQFGDVASPGIADRGLTPQQHQQLLLSEMKKSEQGSYLTSFQQPSNNPPPGHQRNVSRFSFANDTASASASVKPVANPKLLSQQSSIMAQAAGFGGNTQQQFYTSNVQGPPPGLKTTGTPPVSGGMTFGQGHGFATGGLQYGAGATGRNPNEEMMRNLLRGREAGSVDAAAAKRELHSQFTSPPNHYSSAVAAAAAGYPSQSYGQQAAGSGYTSSVFSDGEKQGQRGKKKSKKHARTHGNTSSTSSGIEIGSGADPHLLQSRFQAAGAAAAATGDIDFPPLAAPPSRQASLNLDDGAMSVIGSRHSTPPVPPGFEKVAAQQASRSSTPAIPPGLEKKVLTAVPANLENDGPISRPGSRASLRRQASGAQIVPALPLKPLSRPGTPARLAAERVEEETPTKAPRGSALAVEEKVEDDGEVDEVKLGAAEEKEVGAEVATLLKAEVPVESEQEKAANVDEHKTAEVPKSRKSSIVASMQPASKGQATVQASDAKAAPVTPSKPDTKKDDAQKRKHPGKLDITAAVTKREEATAAGATSAKGTPVEASTPSRPQRTVSAIFATSKPESPSVASPAIKTAPRTLRLVSTPKAETPPPQPLATPSLPTVAAKQPSRQPSVASINPLPGTPSSEQVSISDAISMTSTSVSRANSPPPGPSRVGSAPVRAKTKSQMKKERQERAKAVEEAKLEEVGVKSVSEEPAREAIVARKKKAKKEKEPRAPRSKKEKEREVGGETAETTPTVSRPVSPGAGMPAAVAAKEEDVPMVSAEVRQTPTQTAAPAHLPATPTMLSSPGAPEPSPPATPTLTAATLLADLKDAHPEIQKCIESFFRTPTSTHFKPTQPISPKDLQHPLQSWKPEFDIQLTKEEIEALLSRTIPAVRYGGENSRHWSRGMVTPTGAHLRALSEELEERFLELEKCVREMPDPLRWRSSKPQNDTQFPSIDLEALLRSFENGAHGGSGRGVSVMEQMVQEGSGMKKGAFLVDEAGRYVNEFVMPPATPPPQQHQSNDVGVGGGGRVAQATATAQGGVSVDIAERAWSEGKRVAEEKEGGLKKMIKRNKKLLGLA